MPIDLGRRQFLASVAGAASLLWLPPSAALALPGRMVVQFAGDCSFCGKKLEEVFGLAGVVARPVRICDECIALCMDIMAEEDRAPMPPPPPAPAEAPLGRDLIERVSTALGVEIPPGLDPDAALDEMVAEYRARLAPPNRRPIHLSCSFCDRPQKEVKKLIAGPHVYTCDTCIGDAAALFISRGRNLRR